METLTPWITPTLVIALFVWLRSEFNTRFSTIEKRFENVDRRFDEAARDNAKRFEKAISSPLVREPAPFVTRCRRRTVANTDSITFDVRR